MTPQLALAERLTWGELLAGKARHLNIRKLSDLAQAHFGGKMNRTSLSDIYNLEAPPTTGIVGFRAWVILTAIEEDPDTWGVPVDVVPPAFDPERLREVLIRHSPCNPIMAGESVCARTRAA